MVSFGGSRTFDFEGSGCSIVDTLSCEAVLMCWRSLVDVHISFGARVWDMSFSLLYNTQALALKRRACNSYVHLKNAFTVLAPIKVQFFRAYHSNSQCASPRSRWQLPKFSSKVRMSSAGGAGLVSAGLYAVVSNPASVGAKPEEADEKAHHLKNGKGFINPWDSFRDFVGWQMGMGLLW